MKKQILFALIAILSLAVPASAQIKWNTAQLWNLKANNTPTASAKYNGKGVSVSGGTRDTVVSADTTNALFQVQYASDLVISDSVVRTAAILAGTIKLYGTDDTTSGGKWFQIYPDTVSSSGVVGFNGYTVTNTASQKAVWTVRRFPYLYGRLQWINSTGSGYQLVTVAGKW